MNTWDSILNAVREPVRIKLHDHIDDIIWLRVSIHIETDVIRLHRIISSTISNDINQVMGSDI